MHPKLYHQGYIKRTHLCSVYTPFFITRCTKNFTLTFILQLSRFCIHLHPSIHFWDHSQVCSIYPLIFNLSFFWGSYLWPSSVVPSKLLTAPSNVPWFKPTYVSFIVLKVYYMLVLSTFLTAFWKYKSLLYFKIEPLIFWPWIWILFFSKFVEAKHG